MKRLALVPVLALAAACDDGSSWNVDQISCAIVSPAQDVLVHELQTVDVSLGGPVALVELLANGAVVAQTDLLPETPPTVSLEWNTAGGPDGVVELTARVMSLPGDETTSQTVFVDVDNTAPVVAFGLARLAVVRSMAHVPLTVDEAHVDGIRVWDENGDVFNGTLDGFSTFTWDTTTAEDRIHWMGVEVTDDVGHSTRVENFPLIVANYGDSFTVQYDPSAQLYVPADYATAEYHTRGMVPTYAGVKRIISWITWDASAGWLVEYSIGEGLCPHRGISFVSDESDSGEIIIELGRDELPSRVVNLFPVEERTSTTFPTNDDPLTFGMFFGHASPLEPADHVGQRLPIEMHMVLIEEPPAP